jgi:uncharacterized protein (UPF0248 family)
VRTLRELLNRLRWDANAASEAVVLTMRSREGGVEKLEETVFDSVAAILPGGVTLADGTFVPYHRVVSVRRGGEVLWKSGGR